MPSHDKEEDYWLGVVMTQPKQVAQKKKQVVDGIELERDDVYFHVNWMNLDHVNDSGGRKFSMGVQNEPEIVFLAE